MNLEPFARICIWWTPPGKAILDRHRLIAQVMELGTFEDVQALRNGLGDEEFEQVLRQARPGEFSDRSWHYWHLVLGLALLGAVASTPVRTLA